MEEFNNKIKGGAINNLNNFLEINKNNKKELYDYDEKAEESEEIPFKRNTKILKIIEHMHNNIINQDNINKEIKDIYKDYIKEDKKRAIKRNITKKDFILMTILGFLFNILYLVGIFTIKSVMDNLFKNLKVSLKNFLFKKSYLEKFKLTDFKSRFLSSYNFYERYFNNISTNEINFNLIMFWNFTGLFLYKNFRYKTSVTICFVISILLLILIFAFDFLDIDNITYKYSFIKLLWLIFLYLFLWIIVGSSALLSNYVYAEYFKIIYYQFRNQLNKKDESNDSTNKYSITLSETNLSLDKKKLIEYGNADFIYFPFFIFIIFTSFFISLDINKSISKYKKNYMAKKLKISNNIYIYSKIYSKEKNIFIFCVCIPYLGEIILSLIIYFIFHLIFKDKKEEKKEEKKIEKKKNNQDINDLILEEVSIKKICGYLILNQTFSIKDEKSNNKNCCENLKLFCKSFFDCFKKLFFCCNCCNTCNCCCENNISYRQKELSFTICYQEKIMLKWFYDSINNKIQTYLFFFACLNFYCQLFSLGFEFDYYENKNSENEVQENIFLILSIGCFIFLLIFMKLFDEVDIFDSLGIQIFGEKYNRLQNVILVGLIIDIINSLISLIISIIYLNNKVLFNKITDQFICILFNKFNILTLSYICLKLDIENELISNSTFTTIYLFLSNIILDIIKTLLTVKILIIIQIIASSLFLILFTFLFFKYKDKIKQYISETKNKILNK